MKRKLTVLTLTLGILLLAVPAFAHHSFSSEFDINQPVTLVGKLTKLDWVNPHGFIYLDVKGPDGKIVNWGLEMGPPNGLERSGWSRNTMQVGDEVIVEGTLAKDGSKQANVRSVTMADTGKKLGGASSEGKQ